MPYDLDLGGRVVHLRLYGMVTAAELRSAVNSIAVDPAFHEQRIHLVDCRAATLPPLNADVLDAMVPILGATSTNPHIDTIFVPDCEQTRALARFCVPVSRHLRSISFFADSDAAHDWIHAQTTSLTLTQKR